MSDDLYSGMFPALLIPMNPDYSVDIDALVEHINYLCKNGCKGGLVYTQHISHFIVLILFNQVYCLSFRALFGTTSEQVSYSVAEKIRVLNAVVEKGVDPKKLMLGCGHRYANYFSSILYCIFLTTNCYFVLVQLKTQLT